MIIKVTTGRIRVGSASFASSNPIDWAFPLQTMQEGIYFGIAMALGIDEEDLYKAVSKHLLNN